MRLGWQECAHVSITGDTRKGSGLGKRTGDSEPGKGPERG